MQNQKTWEAIRYSGEVKVKIRYDDYTSQWECKVITSEGHRTIWVGSKNWVAQKLAVDSKDAWDMAARTAINFAIAEDDDGLDKRNIGVSNYCSYTDNLDIWVGRDFTHAIWKWAQEIDTQLKVRKMKT